jgi:hypothetical protein
MTLAMRALTVERTATFELPRLKVDFSRILLRPNVFLRPEITLSEKKVFDPSRI